MFRILTASNITKFQVKGGVSIVDEKSKEILKHFDSIFNTRTLDNIDFYNLPMLKMLFEYFEEDLYTPSAKYKELRKKHIEVADLLEKTFTEAQKTLFEKYWELGNEMDIEEHENLFYFGFILAKTLDNETQLTKDKSK